MRFVILSLLLLMVPGPIWARERVTPQDVRVELVQAMEEHSQLYRACLDNIRYQFTPGYRATDVFSFLRAKRQFRLYTGQGALKETNNPYDVAVQGEGFLLLSDGSLTRDGRMGFSSSGLRPQEGKAFFLGYRKLETGYSPVLEPLIMPTDAFNLEIGPGGEVGWTRMSADRPEKGAYCLALGRVRQPWWLQRDGQHLRRTPESGPLEWGRPGIAGLGVVAQGHLELSNVNLIEQQYVAEALKRYAGLVGFPHNDLFRP